MKKEKKDEIEHKRKTLLKIAEIISDTAEVLSNLTLYAEGIVSELEIVSPIESEEYDEFLEKWYEQASQEPDGLMPEQPVVFRWIADYYKRLLE